MNSSSSYNYHLFPGALSPGFLIFDPEDYIFNTILLKTLKIQ